jgi:hypothetical protein
MLRGGFEVALLCPMKSLGLAKLKSRGYAPFCADLIFSLRAPYKCG